MFPDAAKRFACCVDAPLEPAGAAPHIVVSTPGRRSQSVERYFRSRAAVPESATTSTP